MSVRILFDLLINNPSDLGEALRRIGEGYLLVSNLVLSEVRLSFVRKENQEPEIFHKQSIMLEF